jgi:hypothetical protein
MNAVEKVSRIRLQRLVDGELDLQERIAVLQELDRNPSQWRDVALAFVEEQTFTKEICKEQAFVSTVTTVKVTPNTPITTAPMATNTSWKTFLSLAASTVLLIAGFAIGNRLGNGSRSSNPDQASLAAMVPGTPNTARNNAIAFEQTGTMKLVGGNQFPASNVEVPIYEAPSFEEQILLGKDQQELVRIQEQLRRYGLELDVQVQMLEGQLPDGRRVVVPIRNVSTRPAGL